MADKKRFIEAFHHVTGVKPRIDENVNVAPTGFVTDKVKVNFYHFEEWDSFKEVLRKYPDAADFNVTNSAARVNWFGELKTASWGISGLAVAVNTIYFSVNVKFFDAQNDLIDEDHLSFDSTEIKDFTASMEMTDLTITDDIFPSLVEIDFVAKQIKITF